MTILTGAEKQLLETRPHRSKLYLSIYQPQVALACQVADAAITKGETSLTYDGVTAGSWTYVQGGFIMLVGTTPGGCEKGRIRVRYATAALIEVASNSHINWEDDDYLTILKFVEINPRYQRIIEDPANPLNTLWYKDNDIVYTDQNSVLGSFVCMGSHFAGFRENGVCNVYYTATGTNNFKGDALTYDWFFEGATVTGSSAYVPGYISYDTCGHYTTRLIVNNASGGYDVSYRHVSIYDRPGEGPNVPILQWEMDDLSGSREAGGYKTRIRIFEDIPEDTIRDGALVVIFGDDWYGNTKQSFGGNAINRSSIFFVGYIIDGTIEYDYRAGQVEFDVGSPTEIMRQMEAFSIDITSSTDPAGQAASDPNYPSGWTLLLNMNIQRALYHYWKWHSTVLLANDVEFRGTDQLIEHFSSDRESLYDGANTLIKSAIGGYVVADRQGKIWLEVEASVTNNASGTFPVSMELEKHFWMGEPAIVEKQKPEVSYLETGGVQYDGPAAATFSAYLSCAPGTEPGPKGKMEEIQGFALTSQAQLNTLTGNLYAWMNSRYPRIDYHLNGNYRNLDIAPQELISITVDANDTPRNITFAEKPFAVREMNWAYDPRQEFLLPTLVVHEITQGFDGDTIEIPDVPPTDGGTDGGGYSIPPISVPPLPPISIPAITSQVLGTSIYGSGTISVDTGTAGASLVINWSSDAHGQYFDDLGVLSIVTGSTSQYLNFTAGKYLMWANITGFLTQSPEHGSSVIPLADTYTYMRTFLSVVGYSIDYSPCNIGSTVLNGGAEYVNFPILAGTLSGGFETASPLIYSLSAVIYIMGAFTNPPTFFSVTARFQAIKLSS